MMTAKVAPDENLTTASSSNSHASRPVSHPSSSSPRLSGGSTTDSTDVDGVSSPNATLPPNPDSAEGEGGEDEKGPLKTKAKLLGFVAFTAAAAVAGPAFSSQIIGACNWVRDLGFVGAAIWLCSMALWITFLLPTTIPELACGFMWGLGPGIAVAVPAKLAGSTLSFIAARYFLGDSVEKQVWSKYKYSDAMRQLVVERPWTLCLLIRAAYIPNAMKNYGLASLKGVRFKHFFLSDVLTAIPWSFVLVHAGATTEKFVGTADSGLEVDGDGIEVEEEKLPPGTIALGVCGAVSLIVLMVFIGVKAKSKVTDMVLETSRHGTQRLVSEAAANVGGVGDVEDEIELPTAAAAVP
ncbi:hypothetical protein TrST_g12513 [Triparma strigata]|uniref:VTT domain-containing protein n=1 Tax=Triparma strigata TaxID=1606541 RepID=A0A9W7EIX0_9STRA|nr:hypothetical protein TrST_g12513 [Triparma strigata]